MSSMKRVIITGLLLVSFIPIIGGCSSSKNDKSVFAGDGHPADWLPDGHKVAAQADPIVCQECHGVNGSGGISNVSCMRSSCHVSSPLEFTGCTSCHGNPPSGSAAPNRAGSHNAVSGHFAPQMTLPDGCNTCHSGAGTGTLNHNNGIVGVTFLSVYSSRSGAAAYNADGTCSNISCHGGQTSPAWLTGTMDVNTQCTSCHAYGNAEYTSYVSGQHLLHDSLGIGCTACHDTTKLEINHFTTLNTPTPVPAAPTINDSLNYMPDTFTCTPSCHGRDVWQ